MIVRLANASVRSGHDVTFLVPRQSGKLRSDTSAKIVQVPPFSDLRIRYLVPTIMSAASFPYAKRLRDFDAVVASLGPSCLAARLVGGRDVRRYYVVQHDETTFYSPFSLEHWVTRFSYGAFAEGRVFAVSGWLQDMVRKRGGPQPILLPPGINHGNYYPRGKTPHQGKQVLVLARETRWRGLQVFLDAIESVKREVKDVKIVAAGGSGKRLKTSCPVEYVRPSDDELARLYSSSDVFVLPSFLEGMPAPPLEAMACGGVVVTTDCMGTRDYAVNEENCLVVPPRDSAALSQAIVRAITDSAISEELRKNGPRAAAPWTYERMESIFLRTLESG